MPNDPLDSVNLEFAPILCAYFDCQLSLGSDFHCQVAGHSADAQAVLLQSASRPYPPDLPFLKL